MFCHGKWKKRATKPNGKRNFQLEKSIWRVKIYFHNFNWKFHIIRWWKCHLQCMNETTNLIIISLTSFNLTFSPFVFRSVVPHFSCMFFPTSLHLLFCPLRSFRFIRSSSSSSLTVHSHFACSVQICALSFVPSTKISDSVNNWNKQKAENREKNTKIIFDFFGCVLPWWWQGTKRIIKNCSRHARMAVNRNVKMYEYSFLPITKKNYY